MKDKINRLKYFYKKQGEEIFKGKDKQNMLNVWNHMIFDWYIFGYKDGFVFDYIIKVFRCCSYWDFDKDKPLFSLIDAFEMIEDIENEAERYLIKFALKFILDGTLEGYYE